MYKTIIYDTIELKSNILLGSFRGWEETIIVSTLKPELGNASGGNIILF